MTLNYKLTSKILNEITTANVIDQLKRMSSKKKALIAAGVGGVAIPLASKVLTNSEESVVQEDLDLNSEPILDKEEKDSTDKLSNDKIAKYLKKTTKMLNVPKRFRLPAVISGAITAKYIQSKLDKKEKNEKTLDGIES